MPSLTCEPFECELTPEVSSRNLHNGWDLSDLLGFRRLSSAELLGQDLKLIAWDHNRDDLFQRAHTIYTDPEAAKYVWGMGWHWTLGLKYLRVATDSVAGGGSGFSPNAVHGAWGVDLGWGSKWAEA